MSSTLILLNGRRIANNAFDGSAPDLNMIPMAAIDRIEVLRDGASALYGTDAIGGVINFILRSNFQGLRASASADVTQAGGGEVKLFSALKKQGVDEVAQLLWDWTHPQEGVPVPAPAKPPEDEPEALDE